MSTRNTTSLPTSNDFKVATNAREALPVLGDKLIQVGNVCQRLGEVNMPEALAENNLTQVYNYLVEFITELGVWRSL